MTLFKDLSDKVSGHLGRKESLSKHQFSVKDASDDLPHSSKGQRETFSDVKTMEKEAVTILIMSLLLTLGLRTHPKRKPEWKRSPLGVFSVALNNSSGNNTGP